MNICVKCNEAKTEKDFYKRTGGGLHKACKVCMRAEALERYYVDPKKGIDRQKQRYITNRQKYIRYIKKWRQKNPDKVRAYARKTASRVVLENSPNPEALIKARERRNNYAINKTPTLFITQTPDSDPFRCHACGELKPNESYRKNKSNRGRDTVCVACRYRQTKERRISKG